MKNLPKVIGLVPAYRSERIIKDTLQALSLQDYPNFEVIICDDCSPDNTYQLCREFAKTHPNFTVIRNDENVGWFSNAEKLWEMGVCKGPYCFLNPHDDLPFPSFVSKQVKVLEKNPSAVLCIPGMEYAFSEDKILHTLYSDPIGKKDVVERVFSVIKRGAYWWAGYHGLHRSEAVQQMLPVSKLKFGEKEYCLDSIWMIKLAFLGEFDQAPEILFRKNYNNNSLSSSWNYGMVNRLANWMAIFETIKESDIDSQKKAKIRKRLYKLLAARIGQRTRAI